MFNDKYFLLNTMKVLVIIFIMILVFTKYVSQVNAKRSKFKFMNLELSDIGQYKILKSQSNNFKSQFFLKIYWE